MALDGIGLDSLFRIAISSMKINLKKFGKTDQLINDMEELNHYWTMVHLKWYPSPMYESLKLEYDSLIVLFKNTK